MQDIKELATALNAFQAEVVTVGKAAANPFFKSKYAPLDEIMKAALPVLTKHGLAVTQLVDNLNGESALTTTLLHTSGQHISSTMPLLLTKNDPQGQGSAITYARRYSYAAMLGIVIDEDDDGHSATHAPQQRTYKQPAQPKPAISKPAGDKKVSPSQGKLLLARARDYSGLQDWDAIRQWFVDTVGLQPNDVLMEEMTSVLEVLEQARQT